jgi:hypothetical protein
VIFGACFLFSLKEDFSIRLIFGVTLNCSISVLFVLLFLPRLDPAGMYFQVLIRKYRRGMRTV